MLSATTTKLSKTAKKWFDLNTGSINKSWLFFRKEIIDRFKRKIRSNKVIQKINNRKWIFSKESFQEYAMDKLAIMKCLKLSDEDAIEYLINGIGSFALRATAASLQVTSINHFLREMHHITSAAGSPKSGSPTFRSKFDKNKENINPESLSKTSNKENNHSKTKEQECTYCHKKNHIKENCFKLKRKDQNSKMVQPSTQLAISTVSEVNKGTDNTIASVTPSSNNIILSNNSLINISSINDVHTNISALVDTGSPISFICSSVYHEYFDSKSIINTQNKAYKAISGKPIPISGSISTSIVLESLSNVKSEV